jgi:hypothetical protein
MKIYGRLALFLGAVLILSAGCASGPSVSRVGTDNQVDLSGYWDERDVREVCNFLIADALNHPRINTYIEDFSQKNRGALPTVKVGRFRNISDEQIETSIISRIMRTAIINSGKMEFVEGDEFREDLRAERQDQQGNASESTAASLANETGANFMLTGEVNTMVDKSGNTTKRSYFVTATITNIETTGVLWECSYNEIVKIIKTPKFKL